MNATPIRVLLATVTPEADLTALARALRDDGAEVIHAGLLGTADELVNAADQEDPGFVVLAPPRPELLGELAARLPEVTVLGFGAGAAGAGRTAEELLDRVNRTTLPRSKGIR